MRKLKNFVKDLCVAYFICCIVSLCFFQGFRVVIFLLSGNFSETFSLKNTALFSLAISPFVLAVIGCCFLVAHLIALAIKAISKTKIDLGVEFMFNFFNRDKKKSREHGTPYFGSASGSAEKIRTGMTRNFLKPNPTNNEHIITDPKVEARGFILGGTGHGKNYTIYKGEIQMQKHPEVFNSGETLFYGLNPTTGEPIMLDRKRGSVPHALIVGKPGSGKNVLAKIEIMNAFCSTKDDFVICDPHGECGAFVEHLSGKVVELSPKSTAYINPLDVDADCILPDISNSAKAAR